MALTNLLTHRDFLLDRKIPLSLAQGKFYHETGKQCFLTRPGSLGWFLRAYSVLETSIPSCIETTFRTEGASHDGNFQKSIPLQVWSRVEVLVHRQFFYLHHPCSAERYVLLPRTRTDEEEIDKVRYFNSMARLYRFACDSYW